MIKNDLKKIDKFHFPTFNIEKWNSRLNTCKFVRKQDLFAYLSIYLTDYNYPADIPGLAFFTATMMKKSTLSKTTEYINEFLESRGSSFSISVSHDTFTILLKSLPEYFEESIDIVIDCLFNPAFNSDEIENNKVMQIADLQQDLNEPSYLCSQALNNLIFDGHFYSSPINGTIKSLKSIKRIDCIKFHEDLLNNSQINIIVGGNFNVSKINSKIKFIEDNLNKKRLNALTIKKINSINSERIIFVHKSIQQVSLNIAKQTVSFKHKDSVPILFLNTLFGGYFMSRLNSLIREKLGYTYGIHSRYTNYKLISLLTISSSIKGNVIYDAIQKIFDEMSYLALNKIENKEFQLVRNYYLGSFLRSIETTPQILTKISAIMVFKLDNNYYDNLYKKIKELNIDEIFPAQKKYFKPEKLNISIVGDKKKTLKQLQKFENFEIIEKKNFK